MTERAVKKIERDEKIVKEINFFEIIEVGEKRVKNTQRV